MIYILFKTKNVHLDNGEEFRNKVMEIIWKENNIDHIIEGHYNSQHQGAVEELNKTFKIFDIRKDHQGRIILVDSINDFLIYYKDRRHNTTEMRPFKLITRWMIKIAQKSKGNTIKSIKKSKIKTEVFKVVQKVRESIFIRILDDSIFVRIQPLNRYSKGIKRKYGHQRTNCIFKVELL